MSTHPDDTPVSSDNPVVVAARVTVSPDPELTIRLGDIRQMIAGLYERHLARPAASNEVEAWLAQMRRGVALFDVLREIADGPEAAAVRAGSDRGRMNRDNFGALLGDLYRFHLGRTAGDTEIDAWFDRWRGGASLAEIADQIALSPEGMARRNITPDPDGRFIQRVFETVLGRGAKAREVAKLQTAITTGDLSRAALLADCFVEAEARTADGVKPAINNPDLLWLVGANTHVSRAEWDARRTAPARSDTTTYSCARFPFHAPEGSAPLVSIITSMYKGGKYIDVFLENMAAQTIFRHCELIIIDAASDQGEGGKILEFARRHGNVVYIRTATRIGIYEAWNQAIRLASGRYCTNANLDDCRRADSIELQAATLDALAFVDVVHQDTFYSFDHNLDYETIRKAGFKARFPNVTNYTLMDFNSPHNAPMWRRRLHDELGFFREDLETAADYEFWLRCARSAKVFYKHGDAHTAYFYNAEGLSTRPTSQAGLEIDQLSRANFRHLTAPALIEPIDAFLARLFSGDERDRSDAEREVQRRITRYDLAQQALVDLDHRSAPIWGEAA